MTSPLIRRAGEFAPVGLAAGQVDALAAVLTACGFHPEWYIHAHADLRQAGLRAADAVSHFIMDGLWEGREAICGALPSGLRDLAAFPFTDRRYATLMFRAVLLGQLRDYRTGERMWDVADADLFAMIRGQDGLPVLIFGDSHAGHYHRPIRVDGKWLAPLTFVNLGATANGLVNAASRSASGRKILDWASGPAQRAGGIDVPVILKFGGMDAEFAWMMRRIRKGVHSYSADEFDDFARTSVARYGRFIALLGERIDRALLRVCAAFPATLFDAHWPEHFIDMIGGTAEERATLRAELARTEIPDFRTRTTLRLTYNTHLRAMCAAAGVRFIDDCSPLMGPDGLIQHCYIAAQGGADHHVDYQATEAPIVACLLAALAPAPPRLPFVRRRPAGPA